MPRGVDRYDEALRQGRLWLPQTLRGVARLEGFWDVTDTSTLTVASSNVTAVRDKSGRGRTLTGVAGGTYAVAGFGKGPAITYGVNTALLATMTVSQPFTVFVVFQHGTRTGGQSWLYSGGDHGTGCLLQTDRSDALGAQVFNNLTNATIGANRTAGATYFSTMTWDAGSSRHSWNGEAQTTVAANVGGNGITSFYINPNYDLGPSNAKISAVLIGSNLSNNDIARVQGFLAWSRPGGGMVDNFPATHLFKNRPPLIGD